MGPGPVRAKELVNGTCSSSNDWVIVQGSGAALGPHGSKRFLRCILTRACQLIDGRPMGLIER
jgi:hypothetical protein